MYHTLIISVQPLAVLLNKNLCWPANPSRGNTLTSDSIKENSFFLYKNLSLNSLLYKIASHQITTAKYVPQVTSTDISSQQKLPSKLNYHNNLSHYQKHSLTQKQFCWNNSKGKKIIPTSMYNSIDQWVTHRVNLDRTSAS